MHAPADQARGKGFLAYTQKCHILRKVPVRKGKMNRQNGELEPFLYMLLDAILKRERWKAASGASGNARFLLVLTNHPWRHFALLYERTRICLKPGLRDTKPYRSPLAASFDILVHFHALF